MTTVNSINTQAQLVNPSMYNQCGALSQTSMANDFFGSQAFGVQFPNVKSNTPVKENVKIEGSGTLESAIFQQYLANQNGSANVEQQVQPAQPLRTPTVQDYYMATQIANMFASDVPLISNSTSFTQNDFFAQRQFLQNNQNLSYSA